MTPRERMAIFHAELDRLAHDEYARHLFEHDLALNLLWAADDDTFTEAMAEAVQSVTRLREHSPKPVAAASEF